MRTVNATVLRTVKISPDEAIYREIDGDGPEIMPPKAFSSEVDTGSREDNASKQQTLPGSRQLKMTARGAN